MASVNLWLRGARGKFAGASLSKGTNGETIAREVVTPSNPNTDKQLYQRMIMATVMAAYSAGKEIFDHSFQGKSKGSECQQYFMQRNLMKLRTRVSQDLTDIANGQRTVKNCKTVVVGPRTHTPVLGAYQVSEGTYAQEFFRLLDTTNNIGLTLAIAPSLENETVAAYAQRNNLVPGDIYTLVALSTDIEADPVWIGVNDTGGFTSDAWLYQSPCYFQFWRLQVKANVLTDTSAFSYNTGGALSKLFDLTEFRPISDNSDIRLLDPTAATFICSDKTQEAAPTTATCLEYDFNTGSFAVIRSRFDQDLRSTTYMQTFNHIKDDNDTLISGISSGAALTQWKKGVESLGTSDLILESNS